MPKDLRFRPEIPDGRRILAAEEEVAGIQHRLSNARSFAEGKNQQLEFQLEPDNAHDPNAIKVIGMYNGAFITHRTHIGYVKAELAQVIAEQQLFSKIRPRLRNIWWGGQARDYIVVRFDILQPKPLRGEPQADETRIPPEGSEANTGLTAPQQTRDGITHSRRKRRGIPVEDTRQGMHVLADDTKGLFRFEGLLIAEPQCGPKYVWLQLATGGGEIRRKVARGEKVWVWEK